MSTLDQVIKKLHELSGREPVKSGSGFKACCPAHEDSNPSLGISEGPDGKVFLKCYAGCSNKAIIAALGLEAKDFSTSGYKNVQKTKKTHLFPTLDEAAESARLSVGRSQHHELRETARYVYQNAAGADVFVVARYDPAEGGIKAYRPFRSIEGGWSIGDPEGLLPLYNLAGIKKSTARIFVVEGEKCSDLCDTLGLTCTTSAHGADSAAKSDWSPLAGRDVVIIPDRDEPGAKYAAEVARILTHLNPPARVKIVALPDVSEPGADLVDYRELHKVWTDAEVKRELENIADRTPEWADDRPSAVILDNAPEVLNRPLRLINGQSYLTTWVYVQSGENQTMKRIVLRNDGRYFAEGGVPGARPLSDLGLNVKMPTVPHPDSLLSGAGLKKYVDDVRPDPAEVLNRVRGVVGHYMDFSHSIGTQSDLVDMVACYSISSYLLDAFTVVGYLWPNADKGSGKTKLLAVVTGVGCMGVLITAGGTFASLRDLADYGAVLGFDDAENIMDTKRVDPDKRTLLLAGNRKGSYVTLKEPFGDGWTTRYVHVFCPRLFSAIGLPDETLGSRTIVVPLLRSANNVKANRDPADTDCWPTNRRALIDDLWLTGLANISKLSAYDKKAATLSPLSGRLLEPWRNILAVALWLQEEHGEKDIFDRMSALSIRYQQDRADIEEVSPIRIMLKALYSILATGNLGVVDFTPTQVAEAMNKIARDEELDFVGDSLINARKAGRLLQRLRFERAQRTASGKRWTVKRNDLDSLARAYGMEPPDISDSSYQAECRSAISAEGAVSQEMPLEDKNTASQPVTIPEKSENGLVWEDPA